MERCRNCGAEIIWIKIIHGRMMPCDPTEVPVYPNRSGKLIGGLNKRGELVYGVPATGEEKEDELMIPIRISHFASCPQRDNWRSCGRREKKHEKE